MGFYGNITNTSKTQFQFDRIYSNRMAMENKMSTDNVYAGRYVLIEYDTAPDVGAFSRFYLDSLGRGYTSPNLESTTLITRSQVDRGEIKYTSTKNKEDETLVAKDCVFYVCITDKVASTDSYANSAAVWEKIIVSTSNYTINYNIDTSAYGEGRGYDSTVWQKVYIDGYEKYIQIAELNSVVPTFDIGADAPTIYPITPHFDVNSTNVYYKLHWQPQWGLRIKEGDNNNPITSTNDVNAFNYPSDITTSYKKITYDPITGRESSSTVSYPGAIYFNKAGFDKNIRTYNEEWANQDIIQVEPTGLSGNKYLNHNSSSLVEKEAVDIQEIRMILPSLGNTISDIWDLAFGKERNQDIAWDSTNGIRLHFDKDNNYAYNSNEEISTIAGCINSVHDLMGMIIVNNISNVEQADLEHIYYIDGAYYQKYPEYTYTPINSFNINEVYYNNANNNYGTIGSIWNNEIGFVEGVTSTRTISYQFKELKGFANNLNTIHGLLLKINNILETEDIYTRNPNTVQGSINRLNDIFDKFNQLKPKHFLTVGNDGQIHSTNWTTSQSFEAIGEESAVVENEKENRWIYFDLDENNHKITINHAFNEVEDTSSSSDVNGAGDKIYLYTPIVDNMGHIVGKNIEDVILPYSYKTIKVLNNDNIVNAPSTNINSEGQSADNTQDIITFESSNRWIKFDNNTEDTIKVGHRLSNFEKGQANKKFGLEADLSINDLNQNNQFDIPVLRFDEAGHIDFAETHTVSIPENFTTITIDNNGTNVSSIPSEKNGTIVANNLTDNLLFDTGNHWIKLAVDNITNKVSLIHNVADNSQTITTYSDNETPAFGETFKIPQISYDNTGHISSNSTYTVTIPMPSLNKTLAEDNSSVITGLSLENNTGKLSQNNQKVGNLLLTDYSYSNNNTANISSSDSINNAFAKLQYRILMNEETNINTNKTIEKLEENLSKQISDESINREEADNEINKSMESLSKQISDETSNREQSIIALNNTIIDTYQTKLTADVDYVTPAILNNYLTLNDTFIYQNSNQTLQAIIESIDNRLAALEGNTTT